MRARRFPFLLAVVLGPVMLRAAAPEEAPPTLEKMRAEEQAQLRNETKSMQNLGTVPLGELVAFKLESGFLDVAPVRAATDGDVAVQLKGLPGLATLSIMMVGPDPKAKYGTVKLIHHNFSVPGAAAVTTSVFATPGNVQLARDITAPDRETTVQLIQNFITADNPSVRLLVSSHRSTTGDRLVDIKAEAANLPALRQQFPRETSEYLLPAFRDLGIDGLIFKADDRVAWQIFADAYNPKAELTERVKGLVKKLDADAPSARAGALKELEEIGQPAALVAMRLDRSGYSFEQNTALDTFLGPYKPLAEEDVARLGRDANFLADCLTADDAGLRAAALARLQEVTGKKFEFDPAGPDDARALAVAKLRASLGPTTSAAAATQPATSR